MKHGTRTWNIRVISLNIKVITLNKLKKQTEMRVNFDVIANVPLYKNINQKDYSIVKLKKEEI